MGSTSKPNDSTTYSGVVNPDPTQTGTLACGGWDGGQASGGNQPEVFQGVPAPIRPSLPVATNPPITQVSPNSYSVTLSLSGTNTVQLAPSFVNAKSQGVSAVAPNVFAFVFSSRNSHVATCAANGLVTAIGRGQCTVLIGSARTANLPFTNAAPPAGLVGCEVYCELNVTVVA